LFVFFCVVELLFPFFYPLVPMIDWNEQWAFHAPNFYDGYAHIDLGEGRVLRLKAGPGFGDCSHPTTRLVLDLMKDHVKSHTVIDLGCGSGILSIAASLLGAKKVFGIDICEQALEHAHENSVLNQISNVHFGEKGGKGDLLLINMISSEQETAWKAHPYLHNFDGIVISSGILSEQKEAYLTQALSRGWTVISSKEEEGWTGWVFKSN
jgi:ribosomal protein L11 methyltransferase